jgi:hypothetical protein
MLERAAAEAVVEQRYAYRGRSSIATGGVLALATSGGSAPEARLFVGTIRRPDLVADGLLTIATVARSRFHVPPAMLARILLAADPIVTVADERLRFESLSACCGVYARLDLSPDAVDGRVFGRGTTNVDAGPDLRAALARLDTGSTMGLEVGSDVVRVRTETSDVSERRVPLPVRWVRALAEVAAIQAGLTRVARLDRVAAMRLLRGAFALPPNRPTWLSGGAMALRIGHHAAPGAHRSGGVGRLRPLERMLRHVQGLAVFAGPDGTTGWQTELDGARLTLLLSPEAWRGFSGEGRLLHDLAAVDGSLLARVRADLHWQPRIDLVDMAGRTGATVGELQTALASLAEAGVLGYDLADGAYFHRELPFDLGGVERRQPRLAAARRIVADAGVRVEEEADDRIVAWVSGGAGVEHRVVLADAGWRCSCPWYGRHRGERGPCKHVLAVQIMAVGSGDA